MYIIYYITIYILYIYYIIYILYYIYIYIYYIRTYSQKYSGFWFEGSIPSFHYSGIMCFDFIKYRLRQYLTINIRNILYVLERQMKVNT